MNPSPPGSEDRFARLIEIGQGVLSELDLDAVLERVAEAARDLAGARYAALGVLDPSKEALDRFIHVGVDDETRRMIGDLPRGRGVLGELIRHAEPLRLREVGDHRRSYGFPAGHPEMHSFLGVPIAVRGEAFGNLYITEKVGADEFTESDEEAMVVLAGWAAIAIENARLYAEAATRQEQLQRVLRHVETTLAITKAIGAETKLDQVLELIVKRARALVEAKSLLVFLAGDGELEVAASVGSDLNFDAMRQSLGGSVVGSVLQSMEPLVLHGDWSDPLQDHVGAEVALLVPLIFRGESLGVLAAFDRVIDGPSFDEDDVRLLRSIATSAATAVATAQSVQEGRLREQVEAAERERHRWAHELHDEALQQLAAIRLELSNALRPADDEHEPVYLAARHTVDRLEEEIDNLSRLINELRPVPLETLGLRRAVEALAAETERKDGLRVEALIELPEFLPSDTERTVYRVFQESLTNVVKHANAETISLTAQRNGAMLSLAIKDDGSGFDTSADPPGLGLRGMRERVEILGGSFEVVSSPGAGTTVAVTLPA